MARANALSTTCMSILVSSMFLAPSASAQQSGNSEQPPSRVTTLTTKLEEFQFRTRLPGRVKASTVAEVRPQVSGIIRERMFEEGMAVQAGQALYGIESDTYKATVASAKAAVTEARANLDLATIEARRAEDLFNNRSGTAASRDTASAQKSKAEAAMQSAEAQLSTAMIDLDRTIVRAPVSGVIGFSQTTTGALVAAQQTTALTTIRDLDPVYVDVTQSATDLLKWNSGGIDTQHKSGTAKLILPDGSEFSQVGDLKAAEPQVEPTTGMVTLRLSFANPEHRLLPGLYVEVELSQGELEKAALVPQSAVMRTPKGEAYVLTVEEGKVANRPVTISGSQENMWVISSGLKEGDAVITSGFQKIGPGAPVEVIDIPTQASAKEGN